MIWFTADTHFGHANILGRNQRPFDSIDQMNRQLIANINERVGARDTLYVLGDFSYRTTVEEAVRLRERIACSKIVLVRGNHDKDWDSGCASRAFADVLDYAEILPGYFNGTRACLSHYPMLSWNGQRRGSIMLHGHIHSAGSRYNLDNRDRGVLRYDVGVDANGYFPVSRNQILAFFKGVRPRGARFADQDAALGAVAEELAQDS